MPIVGAIERGGAGAARPPCALCWLNGKLRCPCPPFARQCGKAGAGSTCSVPAAAVDAGSRASFGCAGRRRGDTPRRRVQKERRTPTLHHRQRSEIKQMGLTWPVVASARCIVPASKERRQSNIILCSTISVQPTHMHLWDHISAHVYVVYSQLQHIMKHPSNGRLTIGE